MEDDDLVRFGQMEDIAHYADVLESTCDHEGECALGWSQMIKADALIYWTDDDARWLRIQRELIEARRELEWLRLDLEDAESELSAKRLPWWRRWL